MRTRRPALAGPSSPPGRVIRRELFEARRPALAGPQSHRASGPAGALLRPGAPLSPGLIPNRIGDPEGAPMRPGAPLSPGLVSKTRDPEGWFTSAVRVLLTFFSAPLPPRLSRAGGRGRVLSVLASRAAVRRDGPQGGGGADSGAIGDPGVGRRQ